MLWTRKTFRFPPTSNHPAPDHLSPHSAGKKKKTQKGSLRIPPTLTSANLKSEETDENIPQVKHFNVHISID